MGSIIDISYSVNGHDVRFIIGDARSKGILLDPGNDKMDQQEYVDALKLAMKVYPIIEAAELLKDWSLSPPGELEQVRDSFLDTIITYGELVRDNPYGIQTHYLAEEYVVLARAQKRIRQEREQARKDKHATRDTDTVGYVYLVQSPTSNYKIGRTKNPKDRMRTFGVQLPFEVEYVCVIQTEDMYSLERELHKQFASKRVNGEWFALDTSDVEYIKGLAS